MILGELSQWYGIGKLVLDLTRGISSDENLQRTSLTK